MTQIKSKYRSNQYSLKKFANHLYRDTWILKPISADAGNVLNNNNDKKQNNKMKK